MEVLLLLIGTGIAFADNGSASYPGAVPPPPGVVPDLEHPQNAGRTANIVVMIVCDVTVTILVLARAYVKLRVLRSLLLEDVMCAIAWALIILYSVTIFRMIRFGEGHHSWEVSPQDYTQMLKWLYASSIIYCPMAFATKMTLLLLIARVFAVKARVSRSIHIFIVCLFIAYLPIQSVKIALCNPIRTYWDPSTGGSCLNQRKIFLSDLSLAIVTDLVILIIPIPLIWHLHMSWKRKLKIAILLGAGGAATGVTIFRLYKAVVFMHSKDVASDFVLLDILTILEVTIGLICSCLPAVNILFEQYHSPANSERSRRPDSKNIHRHRHQRLTWNGLGTTMPKDSADELAGPSDHSQRSMSSATANFDTELREISGHDSERPTVLSSGAVPHDDEHGLDVDRVNSSNGRKEGWLAFDGPALPSEISDLSNPTQEHSHASGHPERDIMLKVAAARSDRPWQGIWEGEKSAV